ncbi:MarR family winged helix-turn-helix transcriptional regulator [Prosthecomicrobium sp. N25]|uniref:MarR family winged helix-turn-helix transcriptional regulator n=1 Tax=Prosthecomicrobium sp. N25 TaxID=3129254 RepID=UPI0030782FAC
MTQKPILTGADPRREAFLLLVDAARMVRTHVDHKAREQGTTRAQWALLGRLSRQEGLTQAELADLLEIQPISLTRLVDRLDAQGFVERRPHPTDRRANRLFITNAGREALANFAPLAAEVMQEIFAGLDPEAVASLAAVLDRVKRNCKAAAEARCAAARTELSHAG